MSQSSRYCVWKLGASTAWGVMAKGTEDSGPQQSTQWELAPCDGEAFPTSSPCPSEMNIHDVIFSPTFPWTEFWWSQEWSTIQASSLGLLTWAIWGNSTQGNLHGLGLVLRQKGSKGPLLLTANPSVICPGWSLSEPESVLTTCLLSVPRVQTSPPGSFLVSVPLACDHEVGAPYWAFAAMKNPQRYHKWCQLMQMDASSVGTTHTSTVE